MPSKSAKQHRFMEAVAHNPKFSKKVGVPQSVGEEFAQADRAAHSIEHSTNGRASIHKHNKSKGD